MNDTPAEAIAIHEAGDAIMAYLLHAPFTKITIVPDDDTLGAVHHRLAEGRVSILRAPCCQPLTAPDAGVRSVA